jgi:hypothetical protein
MNTRETNVVREMTAEEIDRVAGGCRDCGYASDYTVAEWGTDEDSVFTLIKATSR